MVADADVLVVGAGPTGLLLAAELRRRGVECRLIDAQPEPQHWDRATVLHPRSLEVFESLGLLRSFLAAGVKQRAERLHSEGRLLGAFDLSTCGSRHGFNLGLSEEVTESILTEYLQRQGGDVARSSRLMTLEEDGSGDVATIDGDHRSEQARFEWVVGCDGLHSITRRVSDIALTGHDITQPWAVFDATAEGWTETFEANFAYLDVTPVILTALPDRRWRVYLRPKSPDSDLVADASSTIARYHPGVTFVDVANPKRFHCHTKVATQFRSGRILLAGDSAHVCTPAQGHGMNSGLQDAVNLAWKLALVCRGQCRPDLLDSYEAERRPVAELIARSGDAAEHAHTLGDLADRRARDDSFRAVFADSTLRHQEVIAVAELDIDYTSSPIVMGASEAALKPGQRLPDAIPVRLPDGEHGRLRELTYRAGHTALLVGGPAADVDELAQLRSASARNHPSLMEATIVTATRPDEDRPVVHVAPADVEALGIDEITLLAIRPDGYVGLRADHDHLEALAAYESRLASSAARPS